MNWLDDLVDLSEAMDDEFGISATVTPMLARPNMRAIVDPGRPGFPIIGVFHENHRYAGDGNRSGDGLKESKIASTVCTFSAPKHLFVYMPTQGDQIRIDCLNRDFRIADVTFEMPGRTMLVLEALNRLEMA